MMPEPGPTPDLTVHDGPPRGYGPPPTGRRPADNGHANYVTSGRHGRMMMRRPAPTPTSLSPGVDDAVPSNTLSQYG